MSIEGLIDLEVMAHLSQRGCIKDMDAYAQHILKTSDHPLMIARRTWMRREALRQCLQAHANQKQITKEFKTEPYSPKASVRRATVIDPWMSEDMRRRHKASWNDKDFLGFVRREEPQLFPERDTI